MSFETLFAFGLVFLSLALATGSIASLTLARRAPAQKRLRTISDAQGTLVLDNPVLFEKPSPEWQRAARFVPKSPKEMSRLQKRLATAGYHGLGPAVVFSFSQIVCAVILGFLPIYFFGMIKGLVPAIIGLVLGSMLPGFWLGRVVHARKRQIRNGLPDALDLLIVCLEAGSSVDQAILKVSEELAITYPALAEEFRMIMTETRAGKPRLEAFKNFSSRTKVEDVRSFVAMLVQTDRFGTSIGQALRTHAEVSRSKRRQSAEERAAKLGVKLIFPLVLCLFPAFYVVVLGPMVIKFVRIFYGQIMR